MKEKTETVSVRGDAQAESVLTLKEVCEKYNITHLVTEAGEKRTAEEALRNAKHNTLLFLVNRELTAKERLAEIEQHYAFRQHELETAVFKLAKAGKRDEAIAKQAEIVKLGIEIGNNSELKKVTRLVDNRTGDQIVSTSASINYGEFCYDVGKAERAASSENLQGSLLMLRVTVARAKKLMPISTRFKDYRKEFFPIAKSEEPAEKEPAEK